MIFEWKVALRFLKEGKGQTLFILLGISVGVGVMVFLNTLITGLQADLINGTIGTSPHVWITGVNGFNAENVDSGSNYIRGNFVEKNTNISEWEVLEDVLLSRDDLESVSPSVEGNGFITTGGKDSTVLLRGITLEKADGIYNLRESILSGSFNLSGSRIMIGNELAHDNEIELGDVVNIKLTNGVSQFFTISGIFDLGNSSINKSWIFMDLSRAQKLLGLSNDISKIEMQVKEVFDAGYVSASISERFDNIKVENWIESNESLITALRSQSSSSYTIQAFVLLAVTLGIASVLAVSVVQKSKQLGILKAMGTKSGSASRIFLYQGFFLGALGSVFGSGLGILLVRGFLMGTSINTGVPIFPLQIDYISILVIALIATIACTISAFLPAQKSSKLKPVEVIKNG